MLRRFHQNSIIADKSGNPSVPRNIYFLKADHSSMDKTLKQKFRQPFGFYMENLIGKHFSSNGIFTIYHAHSHAFEWGMDLCDEDMKQLDSLISILGIDKERLKNWVMEIKKSKNDLSDQGYRASIKKSFSPKDSKDTFQKRINLLAVSELVSSNGIELIRIQDHRLIVSEVKSQFGPKVDYRIEFESGQLQKLLTLANNGIEVSLIYSIALPIPRFVEIPIVELYEKFLDFEHFDGRDFTTYEWSYLRLRIPRKFREEGRFIEIDKSLYNFHNEVSLFRSILDSFPDKFKRLEEFLN
ncbi:hypothetical protein [Caldiplasma sukawensis]